MRKLLKVLNKKFGPFRVVDFCMFFAGILISVLSNYLVNPLLLMATILVVIVSFGYLAIIDVIFNLGHKPVKIKRFSYSQDAEGADNPPPFAERCMMLFASRSTREAVIGDMEQQFQANCQRFGIKRARRLYWAETIHSLGPLIWTAIKRVGIAGLALAGLKKWIGL